jgi:hypothetical protein
MDLAYIVNQSPIPVSMTDLTVTEVTATDIAVKKDKIVWHAGYTTGLINAGTTFAEFFEPTDTVTKAVWIPHAISDIYEQELYIVNKSDVNLRIKLSKRFSMTGISYSGTSFAESLFDLGVGNSAINERDYFLLPEGVLTFAPELAYPDDYAIAITDLRGGAEMFQIAVYPQAVRSTGGIVIVAARRY